MASGEITVTFTKDELELIQHGFSMYTNDLRNMINQHIEDRNYGFADWLKEREKNAYRIDDKLRESLGMRPRFSITKKFYKVRICGKEELETLNQEDKR